ncbi:hypothetical protein AB0I77_21020 [Streptomyces sp. NPDC050619]|uniref:hypothetical protein n=1 Tax=Streptomyces sp. NPDC050619 TaxID=3157214 RepID=UPI0034408DF6
MNDQSPDTRGEAAAPRFTRPPRGRHAIPRTSALTRLRLPVGKALALTALPTALVLGGQRLPESVDTSTTAALSAPEAGPGGPAGTSGVDCDRPGDTSAPATGPSPSPTPSAGSSTSSAHPDGEAVKPREHPDEEGTGPTPPPAPTATPSPSTTSTTTGLADILGPLYLPHDDTGQESPAAHASPSPSSAGPTPKATTASGPRLPTARPSPTPSHRTAQPSPRPESPQGTARNCDIGDLKAPEDHQAGRFAAEAWKMQGSRLDLRDLVFHGVVTVDTAAGPKRVLKFSAAAVSIHDLKMSVPVGPQIQHIDGAPGSTSTLRGDEVTLYVESLTGTLSSVENVPTPPVLRLHLTPDTVPEWLYDTVGKLGLKLQLSLNDADIDQAGQTGGKLVIPGIHGYGTPR